LTVAAVDILGRNIVGRIVQTSHGFQLKQSADVESLSVAKNQVAEDGRNSGSGAGEDGLDQLQQS